jgi:DNA repair protein RecN (Recombination protein N)
VAGVVSVAWSIPRPGPSTSRIGGQLTTAAALAEVGVALVEHHGQDQTQRLLTPAAQTAFLDRFAGDEHVVALGAFRETFERHAAAASELASLREASFERERELDLLAYQVREIEAVGPVEGETDELALEEARLGHVERLLEHGASAEEALAGEGGAADGSGAAAVALSAAAELDPSAGELAQRAAGLAAEVAELARDVRGYRESLLADPERLQEVRERLAALRSLRRKYGARDADVLAFLQEASSRLEALTGADDRIEALTAEVAALGEQLADRAAAVTRGREAAAGALAPAVAEELDALGMPGAAFDVRIVPLEEVGPHGAERVELVFSPGPGQALRPLAKAASGGERSRVLLACRSVLADLDDVGTLVFDEVDAGIGGEAGLAVGRRLAALAADRQVLVVTHLPQLACFADRHVRVAKDRGTATVTVLDRDDRVEELSRMLAGLAGTESAVSHADELLAEAERLRGGGVPARAAT